MRRPLVSLLLVVAVTVGVLVAGVTAVLSGAVPCAIVDTQPACEVVLMPGPTEDTLGLVEVEGARTYPSSGELLLTTVAVQDDLDLATWWEARQTAEVAVVSRETVYPSDVEETEVDERNALQMEDSQQLAAVLALGSLGYEVADVGTGARVTQVAADAVTDELAVGDVITAIDGRVVREAVTVVDTVLAAAAGDELTLAVRTADGAARDVTVRLGEHPHRAAGGAYVGVLLATEIELPVDVRIDAGAIGGPSAGLMFALGVVDVLGADDLTGGQIIAGTGVLADDGGVLPIGGVRQKVTAASTRDGGAEPATVFLVPDANLAEASAAPVGGDLLLVPVTDLDDAIAALADLRSGREPVDALALPASS